MAPSSTVDMNPTFPGVEEGIVKKDALFFNCEKFVGGVQAPCIAVVKKEVFQDTPLYCEDVEVSLVLPICPGLMDTICSGFN